jgi:uncharacterized membrane protein
VHPFRWTAATGFVDITPNGVTEAFATGINSKGEVVGDAWVSGEDRPVRWSPANAMEILKLPDGIAQGEARAINDDGQIAGNVLKWDRGEIETDGALFWSASGIPTQIDTGGIAVAINASGAVAGRHDASVGIGSPFIWTLENSFAATLSFPAIVGEVWVSGIDNNGTLVGTVSRGERRGLNGFIWTALTGFHELVPPVGHFLMITGINNKNQVVGYVQ